MGPAFDGPVSEEVDMIQVTADDIRVLAQSNDEAPVLVVVDGRLVVLAAAEVAEGARVVYSKANLVEEVGEDVTDIEAETVAGGLTARLSAAE
jgi:hypothetical protein